MPSPESPSVVVTGVSTGIGWGTTKVLIERGFKVFGSVRKQADADRLQQEMGSAFTPLLFDVTDGSAVAQAAAKVQEKLQGKNLAGLVNNAGMGVAGPLLHQSLEKFRQHFEVNLFGLLTVIQNFMPLLKTVPGSAGRPGRIVNVGSVSGTIAAPFLGAYTATKFALEGFSDSLRRELMLFGIDVIVVRPGSIVTAIWDKAEQSRVEVLGQYAGTGYEKPLQAYVDVFVKKARREGLPPEAVGKTIYRALTARKPRLRYNVIPKPLLNWVIPNALPMRFLDAFFGKQLGMLPKEK